jgi:hypothetical protein
MLKSSSLCLYSSNFGLYPRWLLLLKIEISSNGQNCSILSQNVPKFELLKHNDELLNIYYIFGREPSNDFHQNFVLIEQMFQKRRFLWEFPIGSHVKLSSAVAAILVEVLKCRTQI